MYDIYYISIYQTRAYASVCIAYPFYPIDATKLDNRNFLEAYEILYATCYSFVAPNWFLEPNKKWAAKLIAREFYIAEARKQF